MRVDFFAAGEPKPKGSTRAFVVRRATGKLGAATTSANPEERDWRAVVAHEARLAMAGRVPFNVPVAMTLVFVMVRPGAHFGTGRNEMVLRPSAPVAPMTKPDLDKLVRSVKDALTGVVYQDDARVVQVLARKVYCNKTRPLAGVHVCAWPWSGVEAFEQQEVKA